MKKIATIGVTTVLAVGLVGCTPGNNVPGATIAGGAAGGLLGAAFFHGSGAWIGVLGSALVGGVIGNFVGKKMDREDRARMAQAVTTTPVGSQAQWTNTHDVTYTVTPVKNYHRHGRYCREYRTKVRIGDKVRNAYGTACRQPDGSWKIMR